MITVSLGTAALATQCTILALSRAMLPCLYPSADHEAGDICRSSGMRRHSFARDRMRAFQRRPC